MQSTLKSGFARSPNLPCEAASAPLPVPVDRFFEILPLCHRGNLVLRGGGLSLFHSCHFGNFQRREDGSRHDSRSGLQVLPSRVEAVWLMRPPDAPPRFEVIMGDSGSSFSFFPEITPSLHPVFEEIRAGAARFPQGREGTPPPAPAAWLDHNLSECEHAWNNEVILREDHGAYHARVTLRSTGLSFRCHFPVPITDLFGNVFRFASAGAGNVLHLLAPSFALHRLTGGLSLTSNRGPSLSALVFSDNQSLTTASR